MIFLKNCERHLYLSEYEIYPYYKMVSNELSIPGILKLYCVKKTDLMYIIVGGFGKKMESIMESIYLIKLTVQFLY